MPRLRPSWHGQPVTGYAELKAPGGFLALNDDDNNWNGTPDKDDAPPVANEDDLVKLEFRLLPDSLPVDAGHPVSLEAVVGGGKIKIYHNSDKSGTSIGLPFAFISRQAMSEGIWVEGFASSSSLGDVELKMTYEYDGQDVGDDTVRLTVIDVDITEPDGSLDAGRNPGSSWETSPCYHFDFQGIISGEPGSYALTISGAICPASVFTYQWSLPASCGTLSSTTVPSPIHTEPTSPAEGILQLEAVYSGTPTGIVEKRKVKIYQDHLARDYANFGTGGSCVNNWKVTTFNVNPQPVMSNWNCHGSTRHAYNGTYDSSNQGQPWLSWDVKTVVVTEHDSSGNGSHPSLGTVGRGDVVGYFSPSGKPYNPPDIDDLASWTMQHSQTCTDSGDETYGANNEPKTYPGAPGQGQSWKWATSPAGDWGIHIWQPSMQGSYVPFIIVVFEKP